MTAMKRRADDEVARLRVPPQSSEAEQGVLGCLLQNNGASEAVGELAATDFYKFEHGLIFKAIEAQLDASEPVDPRTVLEQIRSAGHEGVDLAYLEALARCVTGDQHPRAYALTVRKNAALRKLAKVADEISKLAFAGNDHQAAIESAQQLLADVATSGASTARFAEVDLSRLAEHAPKPQEWSWAGLVPQGTLTLWGAHGGAGKTYCGLQLACCIAVGRPFLGHATKRARVAFFSGEDPAELILRRIDLICRSMQLDVDDVRAGLHVLDATDFDPTLFVERYVDGATVGATTPTYAALAKFVDRNDVDVLLVDNASDAFDADEIKRRMVRTFVRSLVRLIRARDGAVILFAHVDKTTSRAGKGPANTEAYSGSTAWHNSARSRLFLIEKDAEARLFELQHQKSNLGPKQEAIALEWPKDGVLQLVGAGAAAGGGMVQAIVDQNETKALLALLHEFAARGEFVHTGPTSRQNAARVMSGEKTYPKRKPAEVADLLRGAERKRWIGRESYRSADRKPHERWVLTDEGRQVLGIAPTAPSADLFDLAQGHVVGAQDSRASQGSAPSAPTSDCTAESLTGAPVRQLRQLASGGYGGKERTQAEGAET